MTVQQLQNNYNLLFFVCLLVIYSTAASRIGLAYA